MKLKSILVLIIFLNFIALPSIAKVFHWDIPVLNTGVSEEENSSSVSFSFSEKVLPEMVSVKDLFSILELSLPKFIFYKEAAHLSPILSITSPPPEFYITHIIFSF